MLVIKPEGRFGVLHGDVSPLIEIQLQNKFVWYDVNDLTNPVHFYADRFMYLGVMSQVRDYLEEQGHACVIQLPEVVGKRHAWRFTGEFRPNQQDAVDALEQGRFGVLKASPGFGKTVCMAALTCRVGLKTAVVVQAGEPFEQAYSTFRTLTNIRHVGRVSGETRDVADVTVCMIQTLSNELFDNPTGTVAKWFAGVDVVLVDECHHSAADSYLRALSQLTRPQYVLGFSATPEEREDGLQPFVDAYIGKPLYEVTYGDQIEHGSLCPVTVYVMRMVPKDYGYSHDRTLPAYKKRQLYQKVYDDYVVRNSRRNGEGIEFAKDMIAEGLSVAIIVSRIEHAQEINRLFPQAVVLTSKMKADARRETLYKLRRKEIMCVVTTLFDEATDVPSLGAVCLLAGGKAEIRLRQRLRSTRSFSGETALGYYEKNRGYVWYPIDQADFLRSHSTKCLSILRSIVKEHPANELLWIL